MANLESCPFCGGKVDTTLFEYNLECRDCGVKFVFPVWYTGKEKVELFNQRKG